MLRVAILSGLICLLPPTANAVPAQPEGLLGREVIAQLRVALALFENADIRASIHGRHTGRPGADAGSLVEYAELKIIRLGSRALISTKSKTERPGNVPWLIQNDHIVYDNGDVLSCQASLDSALQQVDGITDNLGFLLYSRQLAGMQSLDHRSIFNKLNDKGAAIWIIGYLPLIDYIDGASELAVKPIDDGAEIRATSQHGAIVLTLSKPHGWLPRSFRIEKGRQNLTVGGLVGDVYGSAVDAVRWTGEIDGYTSDDAARWAPKHIKVLRETMNGEHAVGTIETAIELEQVTFGPALVDTDFRTDIVAPVGFQATVDGAPHLPFKWNGKAVVAGVPDVPHRVVESLTESGGGQRLLLIVLNVALVVVLMALLWRKFASAKSG